MRNIQPKTKGLKPCFATSIFVKANTFATLLVICLIPLLLGCQSPLEPSTGVGAEPGTLTLTINGQGVGRTILPNWPEEEFYQFRLDFISVNDNYDDGFYKIWDGDSLSGIINVPPGIWNLEVTAFMQGDGEKILDAAWGEQRNIDVPSGRTVAANIILYPIIDGGQGTFGWVLGFDTDAIVMAKMVIADIDGAPVPDLPVEFYFIGGDGETYYFTCDIPLPVGRYLVVFSLRNGEDETVEISEILHVYRNMTSIFEYDFTGAHFPRSMWSIMLDAWNGYYWDFVGAKIDHRHFVFFGITGVKSHNIQDIGYWFTYFSPNQLPPKEELGVLVDAVLIGIATDEDFIAAATCRYAVKTDIEAIAANDTPIKLEWTDSFDSLVVLIGDEEGVVYSLAIDFERYIPLIFPTP